MKAFALSLILLFPAASFAVGPNCAELQRIVGGYERELLSTKYTECNTESLTVDGVESDFLTSILEDSGKSMKCAPLGVIEERIKTLDNELALLQGFEKLKNDIRTNKDETQNPSLTKAQRAAVDLERSLKTAQAFDLLLGVDGDKFDSETHIMRQLAGITAEQRNTPEKFKTVLREFCRNRPGRIAGTRDACGAGFQPDQAAVDEMNGLLGARMSPELIAQWKQALTIKKANGDSWTFAAMYRELNDLVPALKNGRMTLRRDQLDLIKNLPDFNEADALPILESIRKLKSGVAIHTTLEGFQDFAEDLKERAKVEARSKISWVLGTVKDAITLSPEERSACDTFTAGTLNGFGDSRQAKDEFHQKTKACWNGIVANKDSLNANQPAKNLVFHMEKSLKSTLSYIDQFDQINLCLDPQNGAATTPLQEANAGQALTNCSELNMLSSELKNITDELKIMNALRDRLLPQTERDKKFRNFAVQKMNAMNCANKSSSLITCEEELLVNMSPEIFSLTSEVLGMSLTFAPTEPAEDMTAVCDDEQPGREATLCTFFDSPPENPNQSAGLPSSESPYVNVRNARDRDAEANRENITMLGMAAVQQILNPPMSPLYSPGTNYNSPYYNYSPFGYGGYLSPSDKILYGARYYGGYGIYTPTLGTAPYTAFPTISPWVTAATPGNNSSYFTNFGTYTYK